MSRISRDTLEHIANLPNLTTISLPKWLDLLVDINNLEEESLLENKVVISKENLYLSNFNLEAENYFIRNNSR
ncbi:MAG: hypothetical protein IPK14_11095 [Blastocatellia bacterium]|nr:hypothetical protein [Blastocatellia bacterium]MBL8194224.1 hypothetical protein [Blastocatellia bacterium]